jgi:hypothetical protein
VGPGCPCQPQPAMSDPNIYISCWILGDEPERRFSVHISPEATVDGLKDMIKEKKRVAFDGIDANTLDLYSISVARNDFIRKMSYLLTLINGAYFA